MVLINTAGFACACLGSGKDQNFQIGHWHYSMNTTVRCGERCGLMTVPSSKSLLHRYIICGALGDKPIAVHFAGGIPADIAVTSLCMNSLGASIITGPGTIYVDPVRRTAYSEISPEMCSRRRDNSPESRHDRPDSLPELHYDRPVQLFCAESGSTLRFLLPLTGMIGRSAVFNMEGRLPERPMEPFASELIRQGMKIEKAGPRIRASGRLLSGAFTLPGNISSQYVSGLLMASAGLTGASQIRVYGNVESESYIRLTEQVLTLGNIRFRKYRAGVSPAGCRTCMDPADDRAAVDLENLRVGVDPVDHRTGADSEHYRAGVDPEDMCPAPHDGASLVYSIEGPQTYSFPEDIHVEGDYSSAAPFLCMGALSSEGIQAAGLRQDSVQGDRAVLGVLRRFGAEVREGADSVFVRRGSLKAADIDASQIPDIIPVLCAVAALSEGTSRIYNAGRLRFKESDRIKSTAAMLGALGADVRETEDGLIIKGRPSLEGGTVDCAGDHRIAMAAAVAASGCRRPVTVKDAMCVAKSYPDFWDDLEGLVVK